VLDAGSRNHTDRRNSMKRHLLWRRQDLHPYCFIDFKFVPNIDNFLINSKISDIGQVIYIEQNTP
jgi:hypothetical protein